MQNPPNPAPVNVGTIMLQAQIAVERCALSPLGALNGALFHVKQFALS